VNAIPRLRHHHRPNAHVADRDAAPAAVGSLPGVAAVDNGVRAPDEQRLSSRRR
jgi:hypothetical protein